MARFTSRMRRLAFGAAACIPLAVGCGMGIGDHDLQSTADDLFAPCTLSVVRNMYDGPSYWGTISVKNNGAAVVTGLVVDFDVPSGVHCTADAVPKGATLGPLGGEATTSNHCKFAWTSATLAAGASKTFNYSTDSSSFSAASNVVASTSSCATSPAPAPDASADAAGSSKDASTSDASKTDGGSDSGGAFPARFAAPYVETWNDTDLASLASTTGHEFYTLAFVINGPGTCNPTWNGDTALTGNRYGTYIAALRKLGGDVIVSFGGAAGTELGLSCSSVTSLQAAYQKVIDQFHLTWLDLDVEGGTEGDATSVDRRNKAIHNLQVANPSLRISYTLPVDRTGLSTAAVNLLKNAQANGARVDVVNVMAMDYGPCYPDMGQAAVDAASATQRQLAGIGSPAKVGVTPMIGVNDVTCESFGVSDAQLLVNDAQGSSYVGLLAFWAIGADPKHAYLDVFHPFQ